MTVRLALVGVCLFLAGCRNLTKPKSQNPYARGTTPGGNPAGGGTPPRSQLAISGPTPGRDIPPPTITEAPLVPPAVQPTAGTMSSPVEVIPAGGALPAVGTSAPYGDAGNVGRPPFRQPRPQDLPSPFAQNPAPPPAQGQPHPPAPGPNDNLTNLRRLVTTAAQRWQAVDSYECLLSRREVVNDKPVPQEDAVLQFRKEPFSVYMKTVSKNGQGREILYVMGMFDDKMHIVTGEGDPIVGAGFRTSMSPDDSRAKGRTRNSIRAAGFGKSIERFAAAVAQLEAGQLPPDAMRYIGPTRRDDYPNTPLEVVVRVIRPGEDKAVPNGGTRKWYFDANPQSPGYGFPVLVTLHDGSNRELEFYHVSQLKMPAGLTDAHFHPDRLKKK